jgi:hypothetical protein
MIGRRADGDPGRHEHALGMILDFVDRPVMIAIGEIQPRADGTFSRISRPQHLGLWWGIAIMVTAACLSSPLPKVVASCSSGFFKKKVPGRRRTSSCLFGSRSLGCRSSAFSVSG